MKKYNKPFLSFDEQVELLASRGIKIDDKKEAASFLSKVNYYKFSGYTLFFETKDNNSMERTHVYSKGTSFEMIRRLYNFDKDLRFLVYKALQDIEVAVKTNFAYILAQNKGPFVLYDEANFYDVKKYKEILAQIEEAVAKNKNEQFIAHHLKKYVGNKIPIWAIVENLTFGTVSYIYQHLNDDLKTRIGKEKDFHPTIYTSWLRALSVTRNICAHNARLWNSRKGRPLIIKSNKDKAWDINLSPKSFGLTLFCIKEMQRKHNIKNSVWKKEIENLINGFNCSYREKFLQAMGLFEGWEKSKLWER